MSDPQRKKVGNYVLLNQLGQGQFGSVYKAYLESNKDEFYAIKCIAKSKLSENQMLSNLFNTEMAVMA